MGTFVRPEREIQTEAYLFRMTKSEYDALRKMAAEHTKGHIGNVIRLALDGLAEKRPAKKAARKAAKKRGGSKVKG